MFEVEPLQEYELVSQLRVPGWEQNPALWPAPIPEAGRPSLVWLYRQRCLHFLVFNVRTMARFPLPAVGPLAEGVKDEEQPIDHRREEAVEAIDSYEDDDPAERAPPLPPDDGHEYRHYRVGRNPGLLENIDEGNILPYCVHAQDHLKDTMASPEAESWYAASVKEPNSMGLHKVFKLSRLPTGARALGYRWVLLVVQSFAPRLGIDYHKTFAPVSSITTILFVVGLSAARGLILEQWS
ncbi:BZ3500_MvSof-1268-A1-R1_Chr1-3g02180 [Microbotryum saponariae]|uniref:BZ3500_MvSof-1268-A1-R1_Chr1-3g02180 protein n=1 Tax=Microbotryum saponariae TaxID=289078 RepID=A0A2X0KEA6_9BASI|nr:BZ3500_MvSof-1268-A1-R1_Chr1-3g02180 [Microbotryum saponariae]SCZ95583.1 BZ3501_MvSof-1269-A2-R1_Chr1-3g01783 [Microbotryum saponariae]